MISIKELLLLGLLLVIIIASVTDLIIDSTQHASWLHLIGESLVIILSSGGITYLLREIWQRKKDNLILKNQLEVTQQDLSITQAKLKAIGKQYIQSTDSRSVQRMAVYQ